MAFRLEAPSPLMARTIVGAMVLSLQALAAVTMAQRGDCTSVRPSAAILLQFMVS